MLAFQQGIYGRNCLSDKEIGEIARVSQQVPAECKSAPIVSLTLPDRAWNPTFQRSESTSRKPARTPDYEACREDDHGGSTEQSGRRLLNSRQPDNAPSRP